MIQQASDGAATTPQPIDTLQVRCVWVVWLCALAASLSASCNDLSRLKDVEDENNILLKTKDAVITLRGVLEGRHDQHIDETLDYYQVPRESWWSSLYRIVEGTFF